MTQFLTYMPLFAMAVLMIATLVAADRTIARIQAREFKRARQAADELLASDYLDKIGSEELAGPDNETLRD